MAVRRDSRPGDRDVRAERHRGAGGLRGGSGSRLRPAAAGHVRRVVAAARHAGADAGSVRRVRYRPGPAVTAPAAPVLPARYQVTARLMETHDTVTLDLRPVDR